MRWKYVKGERLRLWLLLGVLLLNIGLLDYSNIKLMLLIILNLVNI